MSKAKSKNALLKITLFSILFILFIGISKAEIINVDTSWTFTEINNILDGNANTTGKDDQADAQAGDTVNFAAGTYQLPTQHGAAYRLKIDNVDIEGAGWDDTIFRGQSPNSGAVWETYSSDNVLSNFRTENAKRGIKIGGTDYNNIHLLFIKTVEHTNHIAWDKQDDEFETTEPSINLENFYVFNGGTGFHFNEGDGATIYTKYLGGNHITIDGINELGIDDPLALNDSDDFVFKGNDAFFDSIIINTDQPFREELYEHMNSPQGFVEWCPSPSDCPNFQSLEEREIGEFNIEADPMLDENGKPLPGSPAIGPQYEGGYAGAVPPDLIFNIGSLTKITPIEVKKINP